MRNLKKRIYIMSVVSLLSIVGIVSLTGCENKNGTIYGINAEITEMDLEHDRIGVRYTDPQPKYKREKNYITYNEEEFTIRYVDYETKEQRYLSVEDLQVGDSIILEMYIKDFNKLGKDELVTVTHIQLSTQRLD